MSSSFNLRQLNLWLGMVKGDRALPRDLFHLGYRDQVIERSFPNSVMDQVCPELIVSSRQEGHSIVLEFKSGANTDVDQLRRYGDIVAGDLRRAFVPADECKTHDVVVVGQEEHERRLQIGIRDGAYPFPLLLADDDGLRVSLNRFSNTATDAVLNPRLDLDWSSVPTSYVPFDQDSPPWEVAEAVVPELLSRMLQREARVEFEDICRALTPWSIIGPEGRNQLLARVRDILNEAAENEFSTYISCDPTGVRVKSNPLELGADRRTSAFRKMKNRLQQLIGRLKEGGGQLGLDLPE